MRSPLTDDDLTEIEARIKPGDWLWNAHSPADALALLHEVRRLQALIAAAACPNDGGLMETIKREMVEHQRRIWQCDGCGAQAETSGCVVQGWARVQAHATALHYCPQCHEQF